MRSGGGDEGDGLERLVVFGYSNGIAAVAKKVIIFSILEAVQVDG